MSKVMTLPKIGVNMTEAVIDKWLIKIGDTINEGDEIIEAETDKATQLIYATTSGIVAEILAEEGDTVQVHQDILVLVEEGEEYSPQESNADTKDSQPDKVKSYETEKFAPAEKVCKINTSNEKRVKISPLAKKMAKDFKININDLRPSVSGKRIVKNDVLRYMEENAARSNDSDILEVVAMSSTRKIIAQRMNQSNLEKPCAALTLSVNMDRMVSLRETYKKSGKRISYDSILVRVVANAISNHRQINAVLEDENILIKKDVNIGVAIDSQKGLMVPVIKKAQTLNVASIDEQLKAYIDQVKNNSVNAADLRGGTFTITNLGMFNIEHFTPIINPPECCILAVGAIKRKFVPDENDQPIVVNEMQMTLVFDHRMIDGAPAARFLNEIKQTLETPELIF